MISIEFDLTKISCHLWLIIVIIVGTNCSVAKLKSLNKLLDYHTIFILWYHYKLLSVYVYIACHYVNGIIYNITLSFNSQYDSIIIQTEYIFNNYSHTIMVYIDPYQMGNMINEVSSE